MLVDSIEDIKSSKLKLLITSKSEPKRRMPHKKERELIKRLNSIIKTTLK